MKKSVMLSCEEFKDADKLLREVNAVLRDFGILADIVFHKSIGEIITN